MNERKRLERLRKEREIEMRISRIGSEQVNDEIARLFAEIEKATGNKRIRVSKRIRDEANNNIQKRIRLEVSNEFDRRFFQQHGDPIMMREIEDNQTNQVD